MPSEASAIPTILFGAFDRHNFGDLLFPHVAQALLPDRNLLFAGLAGRDLRPCGGHRVRPITDLAAQWGACPVNIIHVGGEILTCDAWEAAVMLLPPEQANETILHLDRHREARLQWAHRMLGTAALAPYTLSRELFERAASVSYTAAGGVDLAERDPAMRTEVLAKLGAADDISVRDRRTQAVLAEAGIAARLVPDSAVMVAELFGAQIRRRAQCGEVARILQAFPQGYLAAQFSADFGDDDTLAEIAAQLERIALASGHGVVFFRAGAAPWHDDLSCYRRAAARMPAALTSIFTSLDLWDICALIAHSRAYCGSSLHGRIVALAFGLPRINLLHPGTTGHAKQCAFFEAWEPAGMPAAVEVQDIARGMRDAMATGPGERRRVAEELATRYRQDFRAIAPVRA